MQAEPLCPVEAGGGQDSGGRRGQGPRGGADGRPGDQHWGRVGGPWCGAVVIVSAQALVS